MVALQAEAFDRYTAHGGPVRDLTLSPDGSTLVSASFDYSAVVWQAPSLAEMGALYAHEAAVNTARFSPDGAWLATAGDDGKIYLWPREDLTDDDPEPIILNGHRGKVVHLAFSPDGSTLASASWDGSIGMWPLDQGPELAEMRSRFITGHDGPVNGVQFTADGTHLYSAGYDGDIRYWRLSNDEYLRSLVRNGSAVGTQSFNSTYYCVSANGVVSSRINLDVLTVGLSQRQRIPSSACRDTCSTSAVIDCVTKCREICISSQGCRDCLGPRA